MITEYIRNVILLLTFRLSILSRAGCIKKPTGAERRYASVQRQPEERASMYYSLIILFFIFLFPFLCIVPAAHR